VGSDDAAPRTRRAAVDINSDLGESYGRWVLGDDEAVLDTVTSANVACGFHAGDPTTLRRCCEDAAARGVAIGAQVGYPDLAGFGRRFMDMHPEDLTATILYQIGALESLARVAGARVAYVKPHGALYNTVVRHEVQAAAVVRAVREYDDRLPVLGLPGSELLRQSLEAGLTVVTEAFADRAYTPDGELVSRSEPDALVRDAGDVAQRVVRMVTAGEVVAVDGSVIRVEAQSICVHGDTPGAVEVARAVRRALEDEGVELRAFAP
jgi:5-oxoprolinase (ATP-hydrolysing) subunit A